MARSLRLSTGPSYDFQCSMCDAFPFESETDLADHTREAHGQRFMVVPNGLGGRTTRRTDIPPVPPRVARPTEAQVAFLRKLLAEQVGVAEAEHIRGLLNEAREAGTLTAKMVSNAIDQLKAIICRPEGQVRALNNLPDVPEGHYAIASSGHNDLAFYRVDRPTDGRWAGRTFVKLVVGGKPDANVPFTHVPGILARIVAVGIDEAARTYGTELGRCCACNRTLTDQLSRSLGIGPECRSKAA